MWWRAAAARRRLLICQNLGGQLPPLPPRLVHPCSYAVTKTLTEDKDVVKIVTETEMTHEEVEILCRLFLVNSQ